MMTQRNNIARNYLFPIGGGTMVVCGECRDLHVVDEPNLKSEFVRITRQEIQVEATFSKNGSLVCGSCGQNI